MAGTGEKIEWYLAREGQQFGPLSDDELHKVIELGHLKPDDLLWRDGWEDWRDAETAFPQQADEAGADRKTSDDVPQGAATQDAGSGSRKTAMAAASSNDTDNSQGKPQPKSDARQSDSTAEVSQESSDETPPATKAANEGGQAPTGKTAKPATAVEGSKATDENSSHQAPAANGPGVAEATPEADDAETAATPGPQRQQRQQQQNASGKTAARSALQNPGRGDSSQQAGQPSPIPSQQTPHPGSAQGATVSIGPSASRQPANGTASVAGTAAHQPQRQPGAPGPERLGAAPQSPGQPPLTPLPPQATPATESRPTQQGRGASRPTAWQRITPAAPAPTSAPVAGRRGGQPMAPRHIAPDQIAAAAAAATVSISSPAQGGVARLRAPHPSSGQLGHGGIATASIAPATMPLEPIPPAAMAAQAKQPPPRKSALRRIAARLVLFGAIGGGAWLAYAHGSWLGPMAKQYYQIAHTQTSLAASKVVTIVKSLTSQAEPTQTTTKTASNAPQNSAEQPDQARASDSGATGTLKRIALANQVANPADTGAGSTSPQAPPGTATGSDRDPGGAIANPLEGSPLWRYIEQEFPEWYAKRAREAVSLKANITDDHAIQRLMAQKLLALRQEHAAVALTSSPEHLKAVAASFLTNLQVLNKHSVEACYGFISNGEFHPAALELMKDPANSKHLDAQTLAILHAVVDGTKNSTKHNPPKPADYRALGTELMARGWTIDDLKLFTDPVALSAAAPDKVCRMVQTWFAAQLALPDSEAQLRLLVQSLRSMIAS